jgi:hypothetical protein
MRARAQSKSPRGRGSWAGIAKTQAMRIVKIAYTRHSHEAARLSVRRQSNNNSGMRGDNARMLVSFHRTLKAYPGAATISMMHGDLNAVKRTRKDFRFFIRRFFQPRLTGFQLCGPIENMQEQINIQAAIMPASEPTPRRSCC